MKGKIDQAMHDLTDRREDALHEGTRIAKTNWKKLKKSAMKPGYPKTNKAVSFYHFANTIQL